MGELSMIKRLYEIGVHFPGFFFLVFCSLADCFGILKRSQF